jgi:hypothetical protein
MFDSTDPGAIPASAGEPDYALGYTNGKWPTARAMAARYPGAVPVAISAVPGQPDSPAAHGCDGEKSDYDPTTAAQFARKKLTSGIVPFIYCSFSAWHDYQLGCTAAGVAPSSVDWLIAAYPGIGPQPYPGSIGHQWADMGTYDVSAIVPGWVPGRPVSSASSPPPSFGTPFGEDDMIAVPFSLTTNPDGRMDTAFALPPGTTKVVAVSLDILSYYNKGAYDPAMDSFGWPAVDNPQLAPGFGEIVVAGLPNHYYTGHAICA